MATIITRLLREATAWHTVRRNISYWELPELGETFAPENTGATRRLVVPWTERLAFLLDILGDAYVSGATAGQDGAVLHRDLPEKHPDFTSGVSLATFGHSTKYGFTEMYAVDAQLVEAVGWHSQSDTGGLQFNDSPPTGDGVILPLRDPNGLGYAVYDVRYAPPIFDVKSDEDAGLSGIGELSRWVEPLQQPAGENLDWPKGYLVFAPAAAGGTPEQVPALPPRLFPTNIISRRWIMVPQDAYRENTVLGYIDGDDNFVQGAMGALNDDTFLGKTKGTLLGLAPEVRRYQHANTLIYYDITFHWQYRPQGHNRYLRNTGSWDYLYLAGGPMTGGPANGPFPLFPMKDVFDVSKV